MVQPRHISPSGTVQESVEYEPRRRIVAAGLTFRPLADTVRDTLAWWPSVPEARRAKPRFSITREIEAAALAAWHARGK